MNKGSPIALGEFHKAGVQNENSSQRQQSSAIIGAIQAENVVTPAKTIAPPNKRANKDWQAYTKKPNKTPNLPGSGGYARNAAFTSNLQAANQRQCREYDQRQGEDSSKLGATGELSKQREAIHKEPFIQQEADTTMVEPEPDLHCR